MAIPFLDLKPAYAELAPQLDEACRRVMASGWFVLGPEVESFEREFAAYCGTAHCVGVGNGLEAMELVLRAWDIGAGDEVIVPSNTYIATWLAVSAVGATPVPVEPDPRTHNIDPNLIAAAITSRTRVLLPVHLYGQPADMDAIMALASRYLASLADLPGLGLPQVPQWADPAWHLFVITSDRREELTKALDRAGIGWLIHYPIPPHLQAAYREMNKGAGSFPIAERLAQSVLSLPLSPHMSAAAVDQVIAVVREVHQQQRKAGRQ
jgi:dTDP-4-amino-4,6-dideoxygalactose transaminase